MNFLWVAIGGILGSVCRYGVVLFISERQIDPVLPYGTICVNILGCLAIGLLAGIDTFKHGMIRPELKLLLMVGFLGSFTTFASFGLEVVSLINSYRPIAALLDVVIQLAVGLLAVTAGFWIARIIS